MDSVGPVAMIRFVKTFALVLVLGLATAAPDYALEETPFQPEPQATAARATSTARDPHTALTRLRQPEAPAPAAAPTAVTPDLAVMLQPLNQIRTSLDRKPVVWSNALAQEASVISATASSECSYSSARKAVGSASAIFYWAPGIRRIDGASLAQELSPAFVVSEWQSGGEDYNSGTGDCRRPGACTTFSKIASPKATSVGCAREICPNQSQIWVCRFGGD